MFSEQSLPQSKDLVNVSYLGMGVSHSPLPNEELMGPLFFSIMCPESLEEVPTKEGKLRFLQ